MREANVELFGEDVINQTEEVYGLDEEGEIKGSYRPSGHPGVCPHFLRHYVAPHDAHFAFHSFGSPPATFPSRGSCQRLWYVMSIGEQTAFLIHAKIGYANQSNRDRFDAQRRTSACLNGTTSYELIKCVELSGILYALPCPNVMISSTCYMCP